MIDVEDFLEHHGIKGQKWGIRRDPKTGKISEDHSKVADLRKKPKHTLTNQELQTINNRLNLEQNFDRLNPTKIALGKRRAKKILGTVGVSSVIGFVNSPIGRKTIEKGRKFFSGPSLKKGLRSIGNHL